MDSNYLVTPSPATPFPGHHGSDNGTLYTSEFYVMLQKLGQLTDRDRIDYANTIGSCISPNGMLNRAPIGQLAGQESVDNYYGVLNGCKQLDNTEIPRKFLWATIRYLGFLNNINPGTCTLQSFLIRQPQLLASMVAAAFPSYSNPFHFCIRLVAMPLFLIAAVSIAISCIGVDPSSTDPRRLSWHLWQTTKPVSFMCWLAGKLWLWRLNKDYGALEMKAVAGIYYYPQGLGNNPFSKYWVTD